MSKKRKSRANLIIIITAAVLIVAGLSVMLFPEISNAIFEGQVEKAEKSFLQNVCDTDLDRLYRELVLRNEQMYQNGQSGLVDPFSYSKLDIDLSKYGLKDNTIGFLSIPKMEVKLPIVLGANSDNLLKGAAHLTQTSYPVGGENTNSVLAAHRGWNRAKMFRHIELLEVGDKIYLQNFRETLCYAVSKIDIISPTDIDKLKIQKGKDMITLVTCHPYRVNSHRYIVYCERVK